MDEQKQDDKPQLKPFKLGDESLFCGIPMRLSYVNVGKRRFTFTITDDSIELHEPSRDPIVRVVK